MISPGRLWWLLQRDLKRGWSASYHDYKTKPLHRGMELAVLERYADSPCPSTCSPARRTGSSARGCSPAGFLHTEHTWNIVIHDDGTLTDEMRRELATLFTNARIIPRAQADATLDRPR